LNGHLSIGKIDGTLFTSIILRNTLVNMGSDTLLNAGVIEVKTSPLQIFLKRIYVRKIEITNAKIAFVSDSTGALNVSKLFPPTPKDSVHSKFPFKIIAPDVKLTNVSFSIKDYNNVNSTRVYDYLNMHDLSIKNLNLSLIADLDIGNNEYDIQINKFSFAPNIKNFKLNDFSGEFYADTNGVYINNMKILTDGSDILLKAKVNKFNLFDSTAFSKIEKAEFDVNLKASKFNFDDLSSFINEVNFLKGTATLELEAAGTLKDLTYNKIELNYNDTHLELKGKIQDVLNADKMFISADFKNSRIRESDADKLLPSFHIPVYKEYGIVKFDTLKYSGNPLNFKTTAFLRSDRGSAGVSGTLDLRKDDMQYDVAFFTRNFDLAPLTGLVTNLNSRGSIKGSGVSPEKLNSTIRFLGNGALGGSSILDSLEFNADANNKKITYNLNLKSDTTSALINGNFDFSNKERPVYNLSGLVRRLNLAAFTSDTSFKSNINLDFEGNGSSLDLDKLDLYLTMNVSKSMIHNVYIDSTRAIADIRSNNNGERVINLISDLADITFTGKFSINNAVSLLSKESGLISGEVSDKINTILYPDSIFNKQVKTGIAVQTSRKKKIIQPLPASMDIKYYIEFKNFNLLSLFLGTDQFKIDGDMSGEFKNNGNDVLFSANTNLNRLEYWEKSNIFYLEGFALNLNIQNNVDSTSLTNLTANLQITSDMIYAGSDIKDVNLDLKLKDEMAEVSLSGNLENHSNAKIQGKVDLTDGTIKLNLDSLDYAYNNFRMVNKGNVKINYSKDNIIIDNFDLVRNNSEIGIRGSLSRYGSQDLKLEMSNINGNDLAVNMFNLASDNTLNTNVHVNGEVTGNFTNPVIALNIGADSLSFKNRNFGYLKGVLNYSNQELAVNVHILDSTNHNSEPRLLLQGNLPIDLSFTGVEERLIKSKQIDLKLTADSLDLSPLANSLPSIKKVGGVLTSNLVLAGTFDNPDLSGLITLNNGDFIMEANNMEYNAGAKLIVSSKNINIDSLLICNPKGTKGGGTMTGNGSITLKNLSLDSAVINLNGDLKILSDDSKEATPAVYGDLVVQSDGNIQVTTNFSRYFVKAPVIVKVANLTFPMEQTAYQGASENFIYRYPMDSSKVFTKEQDFEKFIKLATESTSKNTGGQSSSNFSLDYSINATFQNEATIKFVMFKELNQNLTARIRGNIGFDNIGGKTSTKGELNLLDGSTLEFFRTFDATGTIRFENELSNPYLNIIATFKNYYRPPENDAKEELVAVKIKLNGLLKNLSQNLTDKNNISVYVGADNIDNNKPDASKDPQDALYFIATGQFASDLSQQQQSQAANAYKTSNSLTSTASSTATAFAGSLFGGLLNHAFGDAVRGVELRNSGQTTKFNLIGKVKNFNYTIGGSTDVFQDLSQANVKIEYPLSRNLLLRVERKEAITQTTISNEMINELGLKYRFEF
ncbi:MAG: hypothetical protein P4L45_08805, partial [Ignavibacteriaceae bacterium]|nr:hypothetical protein [Ignavibacteriaceae bacterium]